MRQILAAFMLMFSLTICSYANHFDFDTTDVNCSILIREVYVGGIWGGGDEIGVLTPEGRCGGSVAVTGFPLGIAAWGDDALTRDSIEGFREGDSIYFVRWDSEQQHEVSLERIYLLTGDGIWHSNGLLIVELAAKEPYFDIHPTINRHKFTCPSAEFFSGEMLIGPHPGDQVGICTAQGDVGGFLIWIDSDSASGWAYEDDPETEGIVEGFAVGEGFQFSFFSSDSFLTIDSTNWQILLGDEHFSIDGRSTIQLWNDPVSVRLDPLAPTSFEILGTYPNPFNGQTVIKLALPTETSLRLFVLGLDGKEIYYTDYSGLSAGIHQLPVNLNWIPSGNYYCRLETTFGSKTISLTLTK